MPSVPRWPILGLLLLPGLAGAGAAAEPPLHQRIDELILTAAKGQPASPPADDGELLRRAWLDLAGRIPTGPEARAFLQDTAADKRAHLIDRLINGPDYPQRMQELFHIHLMERLGDHPEWTKYLRSSFAANKPWDQMAREILRADPADEANRGAGFFYSKRLENYGQNPVDYPALTRDVGRLFLGKDLRCCQCHDHLFIDDYKQHDFQGLFVFFQNIALADAQKALVGEKATTQKLGFMSVFKKVPRETGPRLPGGNEIVLPELKKGEEYLRKPNPRVKDFGQVRFSLLAQLAEQLPRPDNADFSRNMVNRIWFLLMGRGLVHPLDLHHKGNPPSHPELLDLLAKEFVVHKFDIRWLIREVALSQAYQRSSLLPPGQERFVPESFLTAHEKRLSAEQLLASMLTATGELEKQDKPQDILKAKFLKAFANPLREPEDEISPSLKAALFVLNDEAVLGLLAPRAGNLVDRLEKITEADKAAEDLYLSILSRLPSAEERSEVTAYLTKHAAGRPAALARLAWALLASTEFGVNH